MASVISDWVICLKFQRPKLITQRLWQCSSISVCWTHKTTLQLMVSAVFMDPHVAGVKTHLCHRHLRAVGVDVCSIPMVWNNIPQQAPSTAIMSLRLPDTGGLSPPALGHTSLHLMARASVRSVCRPRGRASVRGKWPIRDSPPFCISARGRGTATAPWAGNRLRYHEDPLRP